LTKADYHYGWTATRQLTGFKVVASDPGFQFGAFQLAGGKMVTSRQVIVYFDVHTVSPVDPVSKKK